MELDRYRKTAPGASHKALSMCIIYRSLQLPVVQYKRLNNIISVLVSAAAARRYVGLECEDTHTADTLVTFYHTVQRRTRPAECAASSDTSTHTDTHTQRHTHTLWLLRNMQGGGWRRQT
ncbi:hypothetical protein ElyMa_000454200 [Elysia marginata]|uniref:Uncharacterized protein n=1 Tax=Elysia marginata TaxID=1093978 RepID=A0AAV4FQM3_9GAST|nr:hypothetical protein ElyMa_000454200 [Elysia marginata]